MTLTEFKSKHAGSILGYIWLPVRDVGDASPIVNGVVAQLLAYFLALEKGFDPDYPRNLAKSVTVR